MKTKNLSLIVLLFLFNCFLKEIFSQISISLTGDVPHNSAILELTSTEKGLLIPRMTENQRNSIISPANSLLIYQTDGDPGYYYNAGTESSPNWVKIGLSNHTHATLSNGTGIASFSYNGSTAATISVLFGTTAGTVAEGNHTHSGMITGSCGTTNLIAKFTSNSTIGCSQIFDNGTNVGIGTTSPNVKLEVVGDIHVSGSGRTIFNRSNNYLAFGTNNTERFRINNNGQILVNSTTPLYSNTLIECIGNSTFTDVINAFTSSPNGYAIWGENNASTGNGSGSGVFGISYQTGGAGVIGFGSTYTRGVIGINDNSNYAAIQAENANANGDALFAINSAPDGTGTGTAIWALSGQTGGSTIVAGLQSTSYFSNAVISAIANDNIANSRGIIAQANNTTGISILGQTNGPGAIAVLGINSSTSPNDDATGVMGITNNPAGDGGYFSNSAPSGTNNGHGIVGITSQSSGVGVLGKNLNTDGNGVVGIGGNYDTYYTIAGGIGICGTNNTNEGLASYFRNDVINTSFSSAVAVEAHSNATITNYAQTVIYANCGVDNAENRYGLYCRGRLLATGTKNSIFKASDGTTRLLYCPESPEVWYEDIGSGQLINGTATIYLDPLFLEAVTINEKHPMHVFIQLEGKCPNGVYVIKEYDKFIVVQQEGNDCNVPFSYRVLAKRKGNENERFGIVLPISQPQVSQIQVKTKQIRNIEKPKEFSKKESLKKFLNISKKSN